MTDLGIATFFIVTLAIAFWVGYATRPRRISTGDRFVFCAVAGCGSRSDPRCAAANCTYHCGAYMGCGGRCLNVWAVGEDAAGLAKSLVQEARVDE